jgi:hypothetical protein
MAKLMQFLDSVSSASFVLKDAEAELGKKRPRLNAGRGRPRYPSASEEQSIGAPNHGATSIQLEAAAQSLFASRGANLWPIWAAGECQVLIVAFVCSSKHFVRFSGAGRLCLRSQLIIRKWWPASKRINSSKADAEDATLIAPIELAAA